MHFLSPADDHMFAQFKLACPVGKCASIDQLCPRFRERTFAKYWKFFIQLARQHELENGIPEEFQPLIGLKGQALFVRY
jgi:hypothetical protein